jgi:hypothetical protein
MKRIEKKNPRKEGRRNWDRVSEGRDEGNVLS